MDEPYFVTLLPAGVPLELPVTVVHAGHDASFGEIGL